MHVHTFVTVQKLLQRGVHWVVIWVSPALFYISASSEDRDLLIEKGLPTATDGYLDQILYSTRRLGSPSEKVTVVE